MTSRGIDTLAVARKLESAGVGRGQAEAHAEALNEVVVITCSDLATKADLERFATKAALERFTPTRRTSLVRIRKAVCGFRLRSAGSTAPATRGWRGSGRTSTVSRRRRGGGGRR